MAERPIASDCKSDDSRLRRFESYSPQFLPHLYGPLAHLARAPALHAGGDRFDSDRVQIYIHYNYKNPQFVLLGYLVLYAPVVQWIEQQPSKLWI